MDRKKYLETIRDALLDLAVKEAMEGLVKQASFFALPIVNPITKMILTQAGKLLFKTVAMGVAFANIDFRVSKEGRDFIEKADGYKNGTVSEKDLIDSFRKFVKLV